MKLLRCNNCQDIFNLRRQEKTCSCGESKGKYIDNRNAEISGDCDLIGIDNHSFKKVKGWLNDKSEWVPFEAFFINEKRCSSVKRIKIN